MPKKIGQTLQDFEDVNYEVASWDSVLCPKGERRDMPDRNREGERKNVFLKKGTTCIHQFTREKKT